MTEFYQKNWMKLWNSDNYKRKKIAGFEALDQYLTTPPKRILDIGCGLAWESRQFNSKYNSELWLMDGDVSTNSTKDPNKANHGKWHQDSKDLLFYHSIDFLDSKFKEANITNYHLVDVNNIVIPEDVKFDLITSWLSCGFHYPASTYRELILKHSHKNTVVVMDLRILAKQTQPIVEDGVEVIEIINTRSKYNTTHIRIV
jgi:SAM-dependent methyltransferase